MREDFFETPIYVDNNGVKIAVYADKPAESTGKPCVVFMHGFPELAYSWRHQIPAMLEAGHPVICFDGRGYGLSDAPDLVADYSMRHLTNDILSILNFFDLKKVVFAGHDWGALVLWSLPFYMPERILGLIGMNVPFKPRRDMDTVQLLTQMFGEDNYINWFQKEGVADNVFNADIAKSFRFFMRVADKDKGPEGSSLSSKTLSFQKLFERPEETWPGKVLLSDEELAFYTQRYSRNGFTGPINWYRNFHENWLDMEQYQPLGVSRPQIKFPCLMFLAAKDPVCPPEGAHDLGEYCPDLKTHLVESSGHWTQQEAPDEVNREMIRWLNKRFC